MIISSLSQMYWQCVLVLCDTGPAQSVHAPCSEPRLQYIPWHSIGECRRKHLAFILWVWVNFLAIACPECFYSCHIFHSPHISYKNLHGATARRLRSSEYRGLYSSVSLRLPFRPMLILLCGVSCIFYIVPLQERNKTGRACDLTPVPTPSSCVSQAYHTTDFSGLLHSLTLSLLWASSLSPLEVGLSLERIYNGPFKQFQQRSWLFWDDICGCFWARMI